MWKDVERAAIEAVKTGETIETCRCKFFSKNQFLWIELPSGRRLAYRDPQIIWRAREYEVSEVELDDDGNEIITKVKKISEPQETLEFWAVNSKTKKWALERTWGGTLTENLVQSCARDLMMPAMVRLEKSGFTALLMVHDEGINEFDKNQRTVEEFVKIICERPAWADGLPLEAKGWKGPRYRK